MFTPGKVAIGRLNLNTEEGHEIEVDSTLPHPEYDAPTTNNDVMLIFLEEPADPSIEFVKLNFDASSPGVNAPVVAAGWGVTNPATDTPSDVLMSVEVNTISNEECEQSQGSNGALFNSYEGRITHGMLCAADSGQDSCQGDSGGPLVLEGSYGALDVQVGIVSWGIGCANPNFPGVYARLSSYYDWIREEVCKKSLYPPAEFDCDEVNRAVCTDTPDWTDYWGESCSWYEVNDEEGCSRNGSDGNEASGYAKDNCCHCRDDDTSSSVPGVNSNDDPSFFSTSGLCTDTAGWEDSFGDGCSWYNDHDSPGCPLYGQDVGDLGTAKDNCCYCMLD